MTASLSMASNGWPLMVTMMELAKWPAANEAPGQLFAPVGRRSDWICSLSASLLAELARRRELAGSSERARVPKWAVRIRLAVCRRLASSNKGCRANKRRRLFSASAR